MITSIWLQVFTEVKFYEDKCMGIYNDIRNTHQHNILTGKAYGFIWMHITLQSNIPRVVLDATNLWYHMEPRRLWIVQ